MEKLAFASTLSATFGPRTAHTSRMGSRSDEGEILSFMRRYPSAAAIRAWFTMLLPFEAIPSAMPVATDFRGDAPSSDDLARNRARDSSRLAAARAHVPISIEALAIG